MQNYLLCGCGRQVDSAGKSHGDVVTCPGCGGRMPVPGESTDEFVRQLMGTPGLPGVFAHVQLDDPGDRPAPTSGWFKRLLRRMGLAS